MEDGTAYRNLYYPTIWYDVVDAMECGVASILFCYRNENGSFDDLELPTKSIKRIELGDNPEDSECVLYYDEDAGRHIIAMEEYAGVSPYDDMAFPCAPQLQEAYGFLMEYFESFVCRQDISDEDAEVVMDNMMSIAIGYLEAANDFEETDITEVGIFAQAYVVGIMMCAFAESVMKEDASRMMRDNLAIIPEFVDFFTKHEKYISIDIAEVPHPH